MNEPTFPEQQARSFDIPDTVTAVPLNGGRTLFHTMLGVATFIAGCSRADLPTVAVPDTMLQEVSEVRKDAKERGEHDVATIAKLAGDLATATRDLEITSATAKKTSEELQSTQEAKTTSELGMKIKLSELLKKSDLTDINSIFTAFNRGDVEPHQRENILGSYNVSMRGTHVGGYSIVNASLWPKYPATIANNSINPSVVLFDHDAGLLLTTTTNDTEYPSSISMSRFDLPYLTRSSTLEFSFMKSDVLSGLLKVLQVTSQGRGPSLAVKATNQEKTYNAQGTINHTIYDVADPDMIRSLLKSVSASDSARVDFSLEQEQPTFRDQ